MISKVFLFTIVVIMVFTFPKIYALETDHYEDKGFRLVNNPIICAFEPDNDPNIPDVPQKMLEITEHAVSDWKQELTSGARHSEWDMTLIKVMKSQQGFNQNQCTIGIFYSPMPKYTIDNIEPVGVTYPNSPDEHRATIVIYYLQIGDGDNPYIANSLAGDAQLNMALDHELGHGMGLSHYVTNHDSDVIIGSQDMPSIMVRYIPTVNHYSITPLDVNQLKSLYNYQGFGGYAQTTPSIQPSTIPQKISINTDKQVYYYGDYVTVIINVSKVTDTDATLTLVTSGSQSESNPIPIAISELQTSITSPFAINETNSPTGTIEAHLSYDGQTAVTSFQIIKQPPPKVSSQDTAQSEMPHSNQLEKFMAIQQLKNGPLSHSAFRTLFFSLNADGFITIDEGHKFQGYVVKPNWLDKDVQYWADGSISDEAFTSSLQYLFDNGILQL